MGFDENEINEKESKFLRERVEPLVDRQGESNPFVDGFRGVQKVKVRSAGGTGWGTEVKIDGKEIKRLIGVKLWCDSPGDLWHLALTFLGMPFDFEGKAEISSAAQEDAKSRMLDRPASRYKFAKAWREACKGPPRRVAQFVGNWRWRLLWSWDPRKWRIRWGTHPDARGEEWWFTFDWWRCGPLEIHRAWWSLDRGFSRRARRVLDWKDRGRETQ